MSTDNEQHTAFDTSHTFVPALYFIGIIALTMMAMQPVLIALSFFGALAFSFLARGAEKTLRGLVWQVPTILLLTLVNPLLSAAGSTYLMNIGPIMIYSEALLYGFCAGLMLVATIVWFENVAVVISSDRILTLFNGKAPTVVLAISMTIRLVPMLVRRGKEVADVRKVAGIDQNEGLKARISYAAEQVGTLVGWSLADSIETADSMRARGWGSGIARSCWKDQPFGIKDGLTSFLIAAFLLFCIFLAWVACSQFSFYPQVSTLIVWWGYIPYGMYMLIPTVLACLERITWSK